MIRCESCGKDITAGPRWIRDRRKLCYACSHEGALRESEMPHLEATDRMPEVER